MSTIPSIQNLGNNSKPIILWCHPRTVSSAFERSFIQRSDEFVCFHEPFCEAYFYGFGKHLINSGVNINIRKEAYSTVIHKIIKKDDDDSKRVFVKEVASYIKGHYGPNGDGVFSREIMSEMIHTFLIRKPEKAVKSFYRNTISLGDNLDSPWHGYKFDPNEVGIKELRELFDYAIDELGQPPILLDADDLLQDPHGCMSKYCKLVGISFEESMLTWNAGKVPGWERMEGWHQTVEQSVGLDKNNIKEFHDYKYPSIVHEAIQQNQADYEYLYQYRLKP
ncbi:13368_t:CDS:2 [Ambispora gerdemannii]|uniref:13368_t:CDS:1 n=1 Tax=Ambispora gerdemannii TaxID=144530 RepID=A0A9N8YYX3_9GLOM|nr:13368_t:CDS:2 [Ambispora gerdemannii]